VTVTVSLAAMLFVTSPATPDAVQSSPLEMPGGAVSNDQPAPITALGAEAAAPVASVAPATEQTTLSASPPLPSPIGTEPPPVHPTVSEEHDIVVRARAHSIPGDPLQAVNAKSYAITQSVDVAVIRPVALTYQRIVPDPVRSGIRNFINNLREPVAFLNFMLQLKLGKAVETVGRFGINTTVGAAGLFDVARRKPFKLPRRPNGFSNTLGYYGVKSGPFLFLPIVGPTTVRDLLGDNLDRLVLPVAVGKPFTKLYVAIPLGAFSSLDQRAEYDEKLQTIREGSIDPYTARREDYLQSRQNAIDALHSQKWRDKHPRAWLNLVPAVK
jgi:phospholipid-binding lipoprotein MlaA